MSQVRAALAVVGGWICGVALPGHAQAQLAVVPTDHATVQAAVDAVQGLPGATVRIDSNATFVETVTIHESLVLEAGAGFTPSIQGVESACEFSGPCTLNWNPEGAVATTFVLRGIGFLPAATAGNGARVVQVFNQSASDSTITIDDVAIRDPNESGSHGIFIRQDPSVSGVNLVTIVDSSIQLGGGPQSSGVGITMAGGGSLAVERLTLEKHGGASDAFSLQVSSNPFPFSLRDSHLTITAPAGLSAATIGRFSRFIAATIERNTFRLIGDAAEGIGLGGGPGPSSSTFLLDGNRFLGSGDGTAVAIFPATDESVLVTARNNLVHDMRQGFSLGPQNLGTIVATLVNNTVVGSSANAVALSAREPSSMTVAVVNNLLTHNDASGIAVFPGAGALTLSHHHNGYFANGGGDVFGGGQVLGPDDVVADPEYLNPAGDFHLRTTSPMLDQGTNAAPALPALDADQEPRIQNGVVDIGAFEGGESGSVIEVPTLGELGLISLAALTAGAAVRRLRLNPELPK